MKVEFELKGKQIARLLAIAVIGIVLGYALALVATPSGVGYAGMGSMALTTADLNREDLGNTSLITAQMSRFCEGIGLRSSVVWQRDSQGNEIGTPVCLKPE